MDVKGNRKMPPDTYRCPDMVIFAKIHFRPCHAQTTLMQNGRHIWNGYSVSFLMKFCAELSTLNILYVMHTWAISRTSCSFVG
jgi:hypothetical protein